MSRVHLHAYLLYAIHILYIYVIYKLLEVIENRQIDHLRNSNLLSCNYNELIRNLSVEKFS